MTEAKARRANEIDTAAELASLRAQRAALIEQQTAVAEVLKSISASGFDLARVLQTVTEHATRLSGATQGILYRRDGETLHFAAGFGPSEELMEFNRRHPIAVGNRGTLTGRVAVDKRTIHLADVLEDPEYTYREAQRLGGFRAMLGVPLMSGDEVLGTMSFWRTEPVPFSDAHIAIVETFARQAAVAIQNVRLFNETKEALERQTALGDILSAISASPTATQPVFDAIARNAARYCVAEDAFIALVHGSNLRLEAHHGPLRLYGEHFEWQLDRSTVTGRSVVDGTVVHVEDLPADEDFPLGREQARDLGYRTVLAAPLLREGRPIGTLCLRRVQVRPFAPRQVELLRAFAAQAAIAIENVRLFNDTKEALDQQTATSDVLKTISRSVFDLQAVFDVVVENATKLCRGDWGYLFRKEGDVFQLIASHGGTPALLEYERSHPTAITDRTLIGRVALRRGVVHIPDLFEDPEYDWPMNREHGVHTVLGVPILHDEEVIGAIGVARNERRPFSDADIRLVQTFADQATIAMENVRLFTETKEALGQQTALSDVLRTISRSAFDLDAVLQTIVERAAALGGADAASILRREGDEAVVLAQFGPVLPASIVPGTRIPITQETLIGRSLLTGQRQYVPDATLHPDLPQGGPRTRLLIPFLRDGKAIGALSVSHNLPQPFNDRELQMLETFADQAAIAIENVRLFNETKEALERQTAISDILRAIAASPTDEQPVLQAIAVSATRFCAAADAVVRLQRNGQLETRAHHGTVRSLPELPIAFDRTSLSGMAFLEQRTIHVSDILGPEGELFPQARERAARTGQRAMLATPLVREGKPIGVILLRKSEPVPFTANQIQLIEAFADQAVIAIENVRLFNETKESLERQTATSEVLKTISRAPFELQPILDTLVQNAARLTAADNADLVSFSRGVLTDVARVGETSEEYRRIIADQMGGRGYVPQRGTLVGRTLLERRPVHIVDVLEDAEYEWHDAQRAAAYRTLLGVPLMRQGQPIGVIVVWRRAVNAFTDKQIELLTTFADQAVIAMENVRLFNETKEALEQQTAVGEVLKTISRSAFDLQPVLDIVLDNAVRLAGADIGWLSRVEDQKFMTVAYSSQFPQDVRDELVRDRAAGHLAGPWVPIGQRGGVMGVTLAGRRTIHVADVKQDEQLKVSVVARLSESRTVIGVPMLREGQTIGGMVLARYEVRPFSEREIELVQTFADQAAIAIGNVRLFNEIQDKSQQLEIASRHKSEFLANMSHELRTPLNAIIGFSEVLLQGIFGDVNAKQREYLTDVLGSGQHLLALINDILDLSKIEAGRMDLELTTFAVRDALESGLTIVRERAARHGIALSAVVAADVGKIEADERKVKQILYNLLSNAVKFTPDGGRVDVSVRAENGDVRVDVRDTGIGVATGDQERIFEEFRQVGRERSREGTGLGLTLTKRFVELHGGRIWLESAPGKGSTFAFTLPLRQATPVRA